MLTSYIPVLCPLFWVLGALVLVIKMEPIPESESGKSRQELDDTVTVLRTAEVKWAHRCLFALIAFLIIAGAIIGGVVGSRK